MAQTIAPNQFELRGRGVRVEYSSSSITGGAELTFTKGRKTLKFNEDQIIIEGTRIGELITVLLAATPDDNSTFFSFFLPKIQLSKEFGKEAFRTLGVLTEERTSIAGTPAGVQQKYKSSQLRGTARQVRFLTKKANAA